jgi:predicted ester cyclase
MKRKKPLLQMIGLTLVVVLLAACGTAQSAPTPDPVLEENKTITHRFNEEIWSKGNLDVVDEIVAPDLVWHDAGINGVAAFKQYLTTFRTEFPDLQIITEDLVAEGDKVVVRMTIQGTHAPTGKQATWTAIGIVRITDGKIVEIWTNQDSLGRLQQVGFKLIRP